MKTINNIILLFLVFIIPMIGLSQEEKTDAVYNKLTKEYILNEDGTMEFHYHKELKILTHFAFHRLFGETFIVYDTTNQELKINEAYTIVADGNKVESPGNAFNEVLPRFANDIPAYNHMREMVVTHTGLEVGCTIVLDYTIITKDPFIPYLMGNEAIGENMPVKEMEIMVKVPANVNLAHKMLGLRTAPETVVTRQDATYTWTFRSLKAHSMEAYQDPSLTPRLLFSTAKDLEHVYFEFVDQMAFRSMASSKARKSVKDLFKGDEDDMTKMMVLQDKVLKEVSLADIPFEYTGFKVREPADVWQQTNATPLEKAILLSDWLMQVNINAIPVALIPNQQFDRSMGNLLSFEQFAVQVNPRETGRFYISLTQKNDQNMLYNLEGYTALQLDGAIESLRTFNDEAEVKDQAISLGGELKLTGPEMLTGEMTAEVQGQLNPYFKIHEKEDAVKSFLTGGMNSSSVKGYEMKKMGEGATEVNFTVEANDPLIEVGGFYTMDLPALSMDLRQYHLEGMSDTREEPLKLPVNIDEEYSFSIELPDGWNLINPATKLELENKAGTLEIVIQQKKNNIVVEKDIEINQDISVGQYSDLLELVRTWTNDLYNRLVLEAAE